MVNPYLNIWKATACTLLNRKNFITFYTSIDKATNLIYILYFYLPLKSSLNELLYKMELFFI